MAQQKGLGKGLGALLGDFQEDYSEKSPYQELPIHRVEPNPNQPRQDFDEEELQNLADSIAEHGVMQPLTVRELGSGYYQIIAGERRWRAARLAGLSQIPAVIIEADDKKTMELALIENLQRQDLNPVEEAMGYQALMTDYGMTQEETAKRVGKRPAAHEPVSPSAGNGAQRKAFCRPRPSRSHGEGRKTAAAGGPKDSRLGSVCPAGRAALQGHGQKARHHHPTDHHFGCGLCGRM